MDTVNRMCLSTLPGYAPRGTRDRAALASLAFAIPLVDPLLVILLVAVLVWPVAIVSWLGRARRASRAGKRARS